MFYVKKLGTNRCIVRFVHLSMLKSVTLYQGHLSVQCSVTYYSYMLIEIQVKNKFPIQKFSDALELW